MDTEYVIVREYCQKCHIDPEFILLLDEGGLIDLNVVNDESYLPVSQLKDVEQYTGCIMTCPLTWRESMLSIIC